VKVISKTLEVERHASQTRRKRPLRGISGDSRSNFILPQETREHTVPETSSGIPTIKKERNPDAGIYDPGKSTRETTVEPLGKRGVK